MKQQIEDMRVLQKTLNDNTNGNNWESGINKYGKEIDWYRAINLEISEAIDSTPWKHWKNIAGEVDWDNIVVELTDIWHFILSQLIANDNISISEVESQMKKIEACVDCKGDFKKLNKSLEMTAFYALHPELDDKTKLLAVIKWFANSCYIANFSFDEMFKLYIGKNCLNQFRQDNGYKEGTYIKIWNGQEDNVRMLEILEDISVTDLTFELFYSKLTEKYPSN